jgi:hypothetical protein
MKDKRTERICLCYHTSKATGFLRPDQQLTAELAKHPDWKIIAMSATGHQYAPDDTLYVVFEYMV